MHFAAFYGANSVGRRERMRAGHKNSSPRPSKFLSLNIYTNNEGLQSGAMIPKAVLFFLFHSASELIIGRNYIRFV